MADNTILCPECGASIPLTEALTGPIEQAIRSRYEAAALTKEKKLAERFAAVERQAEELEAQKRSINEQVAEKLVSERKGIAEKERQRILAEQADEREALSQELEEKNKKLKEANQKELELRKGQRELEEKKEAFELEAARKLDAERKKIAEEARKKASDEQLLKMREKNDLIKSMQDQIENLKRKAETGSQERQGEALEGQLEDHLRLAFPYDEFEEVKKGARGADILQTVRNSMGKKCGSILWESKNTKGFQAGWIEKLKTDQRAAGANMAVIMSVALPKEIDSFGLYGDVWVTDYKSAIGLAMALRQGLVNLKRSEMVRANQDDLKGVIYDYITSQKFAMHITAVVNAYKQMQEDLESEKRSMNRIWKKRETQIQKVIGNVTDIYGTIEGFIGSQRALPDIEPLSLDSIEKG